MNAGLILFPVACIYNVIIVILYTVKFIVLRLTFRTCANCAHYHQYSKCYWCGSCYRSIKRPLTYSSKEYSKNVRGNNPACVHYRLFLWIDLWYWCVIHIYRFVTGDDLILDRYDGKLHSEKGIVNA